MATERDRETKTAQTDHTESEQETAARLERRRQGFERFRTQIQAAVEQQIPPEYRERWKKMLQELEGGELVDGAFNIQILRGIKAFAADPVGALDQLETSIKQRRQEFRQINTELLEETAANVDDLSRLDFERVNQRVRRRTEHIFSSMGQQFDQLAEQLADRISEQFLAITPERAAALAVLGLRPTASPDEIKRRYRLLAKRYHPDTGGDHRQMAKINAAYKLLMVE